MSYEGDDDFNEELFRQACEERESYRVERYAEQERALEIRATKYANELRLLYPNASEEYIEEQKDVFKYREIQFFVDE